MEMCQETGGTAEQGTGTSADLLHQHLWLPDECQGFGEASGHFWRRSDTRRLQTKQADFVLYNTCTVRENANLRVYGRLGYLNSHEEEKSTYDDRPVRLHDAGTGSGGEDQKELPFRGYYFRYP